jgi:hypothetical protein
MKRKVALVYKMPDGSPYVVRERRYGTTFKQDKKTGLMVGRKAVKGKGDKTGVLRVKKDFILVKGSSGRRGHIRKSYEDGEIIGRY